MDQIRRYHTETPEVMVPEMLFTATEAIGFAYGVTWNTAHSRWAWKHRAYCPQVTAEEMAHQPLHLGEALPWPTGSSPRSFE